jgi:hypothetical protein
LNPAYCRQCNSMRSRRFADVQFCSSANTIGGGGSTPKKNRVYNRKSFKFLVGRFRQYSAFLIFILEYDL